jgi:hypothetical protein
MAKTKLDQLLETAKKIRMTPQDQERQRRSFAYGNTKIENIDITEDAIDRAADALAEGERASR